MLTTEANELVAEIHDCTPMILPPDAYDRWLGRAPDGRDMLRPFPAELMTMWPVSTRVNTPKNDDEDLLRPARLPDEADSTGDDGAGRERSSGGLRTCEFELTGCSDGFRHQSAGFSFGPKILRA